MPRKLIERDRGGMEVVGWRCGLVVRWTGGGDMGEGEGVMLDVGCWILW